MKTKPMPITKPERTLLHTSKNSLATKQETGYVLLGFMGIFSWDEHVLFTLLQINFSLTLRIDTLKDPFSLIYAVTYDLQWLPLQGA